jgi:hypothetical protein
MSSTRRLAAILAADVAGYSRLMGADEEGTLKRRAANSWEADLERQSGFRRPARNRVKLKLTVYISEWRERRDIKNVD